MAKQSWDKSLRFEVCKVKKTKSFGGKFSLLKDITLLKGVEKN